MNFFLATPSRIEETEFMIIEGKTEKMEENKKPTLLLTPKGSISDADKDRLSANGYLVIEAEDPDKIKTISDLSLIGADVIAVAAIETLHHVNTGSATKERFGQNVLSKSMAKIISKPV